MDPDSFLLSRLAWVLTYQAPVAWIYLALMLCIVTRVWISMWLLTLTQERRTLFLERTYTLAETTGNAAILLGVLGTLIGIKVAVAGQSGNLQPAQLMATFSNAFGIAVTTTIAGGLTYIACLALSSLDEIIVRGR